ncbi:MAG: DUF4838 domain-containing protein [Opitutales bacterium]
MRIIVFLHIFSLAILCTTQVGLARGPDWKPERLPGSARLALVDLRAIILPDEPSDLLAAAVDDFRSIWPVALPQFSAETAPAKQVLVLVREPGLEGFVYGRDRTRVTLRAASDEGLADALYALSRELLGARWYWSGDLGFELVGASVEKFPEGVWRERPAFVQRTLYPVNTDFGRRNGLNRKYSFNHNLARIFTKEVFEASPEVFPVIGGERRPPRGSAKYDAQPDFTHPKTVELAAAAALEHFAAHPEANSFSFSINDNSLFDEGPATEAVIRGAGHGAQGAGEIPYFRGRPNYTDLVFGFMNEVAGEVFEGDQTPYLTALAYYSTEQSPSFQLHPQIMPVLTSDRAQWHDPVYRAEDKALIERWVKSGAERIATWDYYFGAPYPYPRQFTQWIGESIPFLHRAGVDVFFSQLPSVWGLDGPKAWLTAELLRDPEQKLTLLLDEFYENFFGPAAAPVRQFYEIAEQTRNEREGTANWIKFYKDEAGVELFTPEVLSGMRHQLDLAMRAVEPVPDASGGVLDGRLDPERYEQRVNVVSEAFSYTESYAAYHRSRVFLVNLALTILGRESSAGADEGADGEALLAALADFERRKTGFEELKQHLAAQPMHSGFATFNRLLQTDPTPLALSALARAGIRQIPQSESLAVSGADLPQLLGLIGQWYAGETSIQPVGHNPGIQHRGRELRNFLGPKIPVMDHWEIQYRASDGLRVVGADHGGGLTGLRVENADIVSLVQTYPVFGERVYLLQVDASWQVSPDNRTWIRLDWKSINGEKLRVDLLLRLPNGRSDGRQELHFALSAPVNAYDLQVAIVTNRQYKGDFLEINEVKLGRLPANP